MSYRLLGSFSRTVFVVMMVALALSLSAPGLSHAQNDIEEIISLDIETPAFGGLYRPDQWIPLRVRVTNRGDAFSGRVVVRPQTSGGGLRDTYSVTIPSLARPLPPATETTEETFLYLVANGGDMALRVELVNEAGRVIIAKDVVLQDLNPHDSLYVNVPITSNADLSAVTSANYRGAQVGWSLDDIPAHIGTFDAVDVLTFSDVDTATLSTAQQEAIHAWVLAGGHLVLMGDNPATYAGLSELLPFMATGTTATRDLEALAAFAGQAENLPADDQTLIAVGDVRDGARVLVSNSEGVPLIIRRELGNGTVDVLTASPELAPLNAWDGMDGLWFTLLTSTQATPSWTLGFTDWGEAQTAVEILPGIDLLPSALALVGFLGAYISLIGPVNYWALSAINRRGYAWLTIPVLIALFSVLAYTTGFELRGNVVTLSRLSVVQVWPDSEQAQVDQLVGLLAPRRGTYTLAPEDERLLRPLGPSYQFVNLNNTASNIEIRQLEQFQAVDFPVDASFIAAFNTSGVIDAPALSGTVTVSIDENSNPRLRGVIRNDAGLLLENPMLITASAAIPLGITLGDGIRDFDTQILPISNREPAIPSVLEYPRGIAQVSGITAINRGYRVSTYAPSNIEAIMQGTVRGNLPNNATYTLSYSSEDENLYEEFARREAFVRALMDDQYHATGRGDRVYLVGWANVPVFSETVTNEFVEQVNTTLYIVELDATYRAEDGLTRIVTRDQFSWISLERPANTDVGPVAMEAFDENQLAFRFTPLPSAILDRVDELTIILDRGMNSRTSGAIELWNWERGAWDVVTFDANTRYAVANPQRFIGPLNAVQIRTLPRSAGGTAFLSILGVEMRGQ